MEPQFRHQPILEGLIDPLSPSSCLRRVRKDKLYPQFIHGPFKLGRFRILLGYMETSMAGSGKLRCTVEIELHGQTVFSEYLEAYAKTAVKVLFLPEETMERFACGVIGRQDKRGGLVSEPSMR